MRFWKNYENDLTKKESMKRKVVPSNYKNSRSDVGRIDIEQLGKYFLTWIVGCTVSLFPTFMLLLINSDGGKSIVKDFFSNENLFLVTTTLTISVMLEMIFAKENNLYKYIVISIGIILIVFSIYMFSMLQYETDVVNLKIHIFGVSVFMSCIVDSVFGYYIISLKGGEKENG